MKQKYFKKSTDDNVVDDPIFIFGDCDGDVNSPTKLCVKNINIDSIIKKFKTKFKKEFLKAKINTTHEEDFKNAFKGELDKIIKEGYIITAINGVIKPAWGTRERFNYPHKFSKDSFTQQFNTLLEKTWDGVTFTLVKPIEAAEEEFMRDLQQELYDIEEDNEELDGFINKSESENGGKSGLYGFVNSVVQDDVSQGAPEEPEELDGFINKSESENGGKSGLYGFVNSVVQDDVSQGAPEEPEELAAPIMIGSTQERTLASKPNKETFHGFDKEILETLFKQFKITNFELSKKTDEKYGLDGALKKYNYYDIKITWERLTESEQAVEGTDIPTLINDTYSAVINDNMKKLTFNIPITDDMAEDCITIWYDDSDYNNRLINRLNPRSVNRYSPEELQTFLIKLHKTDIWFIKCDGTVGPTT